MESQPAIKYDAPNTNLCLCSGSSSASHQCPDVVEVSPLGPWVPNTQHKRKRTLVVPHDVIDIDGDDDGVMVIGESNTNIKNKQAVEYDMFWQIPIKDTLSNDLIGSSTYNESAIAAALDPLKSFELGSMDLNHTNDYEYDDDCENEDNEMDDYEYDEYNFNLASKFDDLDLPPGVEAPVPWLQKAAPEKPSKSKKNAVIDEESEKKYKLFKQFDTVKDFSDHHYSKEGHLVMKPPKDWVKRIQNDWKLLEKDLPDRIFVRVYEERMDLLRAVIIGPAGTPYHDGLFFFDAYFPTNYPHSPPKVHYYSFGLRLNPNLYNCGKVCLSLLGTWNGNGCEMWNASKSTMLQVLVSIQALVLNAKPYFNEPGYASTAGTIHGERKSLAYNEEAFLLSCKTMLHSLRKPPKYFEDFVAGHFRHHGRTILVACKAYMDGAQVGCVVGEGVQDVDEGDKSCSQEFKSSLTKLFEDLLMEFTVKGADCDELLAQKAKAGAARADTTLRLGCETA